jgi:hypothetical protein
VAKAGQSYSENLRPRPSRPLYHQQACLQRAQAPVRHHRHCGLLNAQLNFRHKPEAAPSTIYRTSNGATESIRHALPSNRLIRLQGRLSRELAWIDKRQRGYWNGFDPSGSKSKHQTPRRFQSAISTLHSRGKAGPAMYVPCDGLAKKQYPGISTPPSVWRSTSGRASGGGRKDNNMRADRP